MTEVRLSDPALANFMPLYFHRSEWKIAMCVVLERSHLNLGWRSTSLRAIDRRDRQRGYVTG